MVKCEAIIHGWNGGSMSYVTVYAIRKTGEVERIGEARNGHGYAPCVWQHFARKYNCSTHACLLLDEAGLEKVWKLFQPEGATLDRLDNILLGSTLDRVWIKKERLTLLFEAIQRFTDEFIRPNGYVETALECVSIIKAAMEKDSELIGVCFDMCSVVEAYWTKYVPLGDDGEPLKGTGKPADWDCETLNIFIDKNNGRPEIGEHWEVGNLPLR